MHGRITKVSPKYYHPSKVTSLSSVRRNIVFSLLSSVFRESTRFYQYSFRFFLGMYQRLHASIAHVRVLLSVVHSRVLKRASLEFTRISVNEIIESLLRIQLEKLHLVARSRTPTVHVPRVRIDIEIYVTNTFGRIAKDETATR